MKALRITLKIIVITFVFLNLAIVASDNLYLYKLIANTLMKGRMGPSLTEYKIFENREVKIGEKQPWPLSLNYNKKAIPENFVKGMEEMKTVAFLIIKNDSIIHEQYWDGFNKDSYTNSFSMAKSIVGVLTGIAIDEGKIKNVDEPIADFLPEYNTGIGKKITIKHLLTMSSGIDFDENYINPFSYPAVAYYDEDIDKILKKYKAEEEPGKVFKYLGGNTQLLSSIIEKATGKTLSDYASEKLWKPLGAENTAYWSLDHKDGEEKASCCFNSNARDFARFGRLYLDSGKWNGQQILSSNYVLQSITPAATACEDGTPNKRYGYQWWLIPGYKGHDIFYMRGILGQYVLCIPDKNMIVVRLGHKRSKELSEEGHPLDVYNYIDAALAMYGQ